MSAARTLATLLAAGGGAAVAAPATYLAALSVAATGASQDVEIRTRPSMRIAILVPAHDEELLIGRCVDTLLAQDYPHELRRLVVIADNCSDATATLAAARGAEVLERHNRTHRGKGHALSWAIQVLRDADPGIEAFVVVDADSVAEPGLIAGLVGAAEAGAVVVQADYAALVPGGDDRSQLRAAAFLLFHRVRFTGKARLGLPCSLVGNGMLFRREVLEAHPWNAFSEVEDLEYTIELRKAGIRPVFAPLARLSAPVAADGAAADVQRRRWEGGRARIVRRELPTVVARTTRSLLAAATGTGEGGSGRNATGAEQRDSQRPAELWDLAADLAVPPLGVLAAGIVAGGGVAMALRVVGLLPTGALVPWAVAAGALSTHVGVGLLAADAPVPMLTALRSAPALVVAEGRNRARLVRDTGEGEAWVRTPRTLAAAAAAG
jgi:1,2-diacylglycerol 3-beta-glucosyltransferase